MDDGGLGQDIGEEDIPYDEVYNFDARTSLPLAARYHSLQR